MGMIADIATDLLTAYDTSEFAQSVTYTPCNSEPVTGESEEQTEGTDIFPFTVTVIFLKPEMLDFMQSQIVRDLTSCRILQSSLTAAGVSAPTPWRERQTGDTVTLNGTTWNVVDPIEADGFVLEWTLTLEKNVRIGR